MLLIGMDTNELYYLIQDQAIIPKYVIFLSTLF